MMGFLQSDPAKAQFRPRQWLNSSYFDLFPQNRFIWVAML
jgi:hypothetical protein